MALPTLADFRRAPDLGCAAILKRSVGGSSRRRTIVVMDDDDRHQFEPMAETGFVDQHLYVCVNIAKDTRMGESEDWIGHTEDLS
jgi:hypothetical protein